MAYLRRRKIDESTGNLTVIVVKRSAKSRGPSCLLKAPASK